jgi:hypothetical protein
MSQDDSENDLTLEDQAADGSTNNPDAAPDIISIDDNDNDKTEDEAAEESAETELGRKYIFCI